MISEHTHIDDSALVCIEIYIWIRQMHVVSFFLFDMFDALEAL